MAVTIGWFLDESTPWNELVWLQPEPLNLYKGHKAQYARCPSLTHYCRNTYVLRSGVDFELRFDKEQKKIKYVDGSVEPWLVKEMLHQFHPNEWRSPEHPIFQIQTQQGFIADEPVWVEVSQPFGDEAPKLPGTLLPGTLDIYSWQRMLSYGVEWSNIDEHWKIKRGDPLMHIRFRSTNPADEFKLKRIDYTEELQKDVNKCQGVKFALRNYSWRLTALNRKFRPRRYIK